MAIRNVFGLVLLFALTNVITSRAFASDLPNTILLVKPSIVAVGTVQNTRRPPSLFLGTGFAVSDGSLIVTNEHVLPKLLRIERKEYLAVFVDGVQQKNARKAKLVASDKKHDLALLKIEGDPLPPMKIGNSQRVLEGELYAFTGFPIGGVLGYFPVTHQGIISAITPIVIPTADPGTLSVEMIRKLRSPFNVFQLDATAYPGNSGSPLYDIKSAEIVGVLNSVFVKESKESAIDKPSGISFAIPAKYVKQLLDQYLEISRL